jgi:hypothetical protein
MSRARQRRALIATTRYANRCWKVTGGNTILLWSWARRAEPFADLDTRLYRVWLPRKPYVPGEDTR